MSEEQVLSALMGMGFSRAKAMNAYVQTGGEGMEQAVNWILSHDNADEMDFDDDKMDVDTDSDMLLAARLQEEENKKHKVDTIKCQMTGKQIPVSQLYIVDECCCKVDRASLTEYLADVIRTQVNVTCPACKKTTLSLRDIKELLPSNPQQQGNLVPKSSSKQATQRISSELTNILKTKPHEQGYSVEPINDNLYHWELKFFKFEPNDPINQDLKKLKQDHILLHITFPPTYPMNPPFVRVIRPRFAFRTGHVTIGGSVCMELLTNKGWTPANTIESVIVSVRAQFMAGGARLDLSNRTDYTEAEAKSAFKRMVITHGW